MNQDPYNPYNRPPPGPPPYWGASPAAPAHEPPKSSAGLIIGLVVGGFFLVLVLFAAAGAFFFVRAKSKAPPTVATSSSPSSPSHWSDSASPIPVTSQDPMRGDRDALVTIVLFSDFQCPFCSRVETTLDTVRARYGRDVRVVWKNQPLPFHTDAKPAAEAAQGVFELAGNDAFWSFHDTAFQNQRSLTPSNFEIWARQEDVDGPTLSRGVTTHRWQAKVDEDASLASRVGARGTPTSFINGILLAGAQPVTAFEAKIDEELGAARALVASGVARDRVYVERSRMNFRRNTGDDEGPKPPAPAPEDTKVYPVPVGQSPVKGPPTALVTIVEFADYQCPFCKRAEDHLDRLLAKYPTEVRLVFKQQPLAFHVHAEPAAELALEARAQKGDAGYWIAHDKLFASQPALETSDLLGIAREMKLDEGRVSTAILTKKHKATIDADAKTASEFGAHGTPTFFVNGRKVVGAQPYEKFKQIVDEEIPKAKEQLADGTPRSSLYEHLVGLK